MRRIPKRVLLLTAAVAAALAVAAFQLMPPDRPLKAGPETTRIAAGEVSFQPVGSFQKDGKAVTAPLRPVPVAAFNIMTYQVSHADYQGCVTSGACTDTTGPRPASQPQTNVNWMDAVAFAHWLSAETGETWRLPTAAEWQLAAAERYGDASADTDDLDPGQRMLAQYERGTLLRGRVNTSLRPSGGFGKNSLGVADMAGNVWEWTNDCSENGTLDADGNLKTTEPYCGVRVAGGIHRAVVIDFVRDASVGGCAVGLPPDFLGVRLVRDD